MQRHYSLSGHFLILAGLYLTLLPTPKRRMFSWAVLLVIAALIHPYLLVMLFVLWGADCVDRLIRSHLQIKIFLSLVLEGLVILVSVSLACWQVGYFSIGTGIISLGYGEYRMNLLSVLDSQGFSHLLPGIPKNGNGFEGFNYLGLGVILLGCSILFYALPTSFTKITRLIFQALQKWPALLFATLLLTVFAITHLVSIASFEYVIDLPTVFIERANIFRASGRMFWPVYYLLIFAILYLVIRFFSARVTIFLLTLAFLIQFIDTSKVWLDFRAKNSISPSAMWPTSMVDPFWNTAALNYQKVRVLMPGNSEPHWQEIAGYASTYDMPTDAVYLGRIGSAALERANQKAKTAMLTGRYDPNALYFIEENTLSVDGQNPLMYVNTQKDLLARVNGFTILAPNWKTCIDCAPVTSEIAAQDPLMVFGKRAIFGRDIFQSKLYLGEGWSGPEDAGVWSDGKESTLTIPIQSGQIRQIEIEAFPFIHPLHVDQTFEVQINGVPISTVTLNGSSNARFTLDIPQKLLAQLPAGRQLLTLQFHFLNPVSPKQLGLGSDVRMLGFQIRAMTITQK